MGKATFDSIASFYPLLEQIVFGSTLSRSRRFFARRVTEGNNILLIGEGNGRFLFETVKQTSSASVTVVDSSARMLAAAGNVLLFARSLLGDGFLGRNRIRRLHGQCRRSRGNQGDR